VVGLYGALAFGVALRARELAIRLALGAARSSVVWVVARQALTIAAAGLCIGGALSVVGARLLRSEIATVRSADPVVFAGTVLILLAAAGLSAWIPARRAVRLDPAAALRGE
jgi:ABC-type antimicrobial peptide transport system permease subunit